MLFTENRGSVRVALQGGDAQNIQGEIKLFAGDRIITDAVGRARFAMFDGTQMHLLEGTNMEIDESRYGSDESEYILTLHTGQLWIHVPPQQTQEEYEKAFSGSITRIIHTPNFTLQLPPRTEAVISTENFAVLQAEGIGIETKLPKEKESIFIGEGQQFAHADLAPGQNWYDQRSPLKYNSPLLASLQDSRQGLPVQDDTVTNTSSNEPPPSDDLVTLSHPANNQKVQGNTVEVRGIAGETVANIRINGYKATIDPSNRSFLQEISLADEEEFEIIVTALDDRGLIMTELSRTVKRDIEPPNPPTITTPSGSGTIYRTNSRELEIRGKAVKGTVGIRINEYRLQLFQPGDTIWSYLASTKLGNMKEGTNVYKVTALDESGNESVPAYITIVLGEGEEGVLEQPNVEMTDGTMEGNNLAEAVQELELRHLPDNEPLQPGSLVIHAPTAGSEHTATGSELLIEGYTSKDTYSVWVNGYKLRLYEPGKDFWNYIASYDLG
ncbi:hypothetical protein COU77_03315, partial [Candidatus Peregrinibacteria bacterium CG10_big_fil_rev_8_21_14_0_10_49_16]